MRNGVRFCFFALINRYPMRCAAVGVTEYYVVDAYAFYRVRLDGYLYYLASLVDNVAIGSAVGNLEPPSAVLLNKQILVNACKAFVERAEVVRPRKRLCIKNIAAIVAGHNEEYAAVSALEEGEGASLVACVDERKVVGVLYHPVADICRLARGIGVLGVDDDLVSVGVYTVEHHHIGAYRLVYAVGV